MNDALLYCHSNTPFPSAAAAWISPENPGIGRFMPLAALIERKADCCDAPIERDL
jgi:hypothetical protein